MEFEYASVLRKMPGKERNERSQVHKNEKWKTGDTRYMPELWYQDVQNQQEQVNETSFCNGKGLEPWQGVNSPVSFMRSIHKE